MSGKAVSLDLNFYLIESFKGILLEGWEMIPQKYAPNSKLRLSHYGDDNDDNGDDDDDDEVAKNLRLI